MVRNDYDIDDLLEDLRFRSAVENSRAFEHLERNFDSQEILEEKVLLLKLKGYSQLKARGGEFPLSECSNPRISQALKNTYEQARKNIENYQEMSAQALEEMKREYAAAKAAMTSEQYIGAFEGGWQWKCADYPAKEKQ